MSLYSPALLVQSCAFRLRKRMCKSMMVKTSIHDTIGYGVSHSLHTHSYVCVAHSLQLIPLSPLSTSFLLCLCLLSLRLITFRALYIFLPHLLFGISRLVALLQHGPVTESDRALVFILPLLPELWMIRHLFLLLVLILFRHLSYLLRV